jgi:hypothetical protein
VSVVSTVVIVSLRNALDIDVSNIDLLNNWLIEHDFDNDLLFREIDPSLSAGDKYPERNLYWGGLNYLDQDAFTSFFKTLDWDGALLIIGSDDREDGYRVILGNGGNQYSSRINLEVPVITTSAGFNLLEINEYDKESHIRPNYDDYFESLEG